MRAHALAVASLLLAACTSAPGGGGSSGEPDELGAQVAAALADIATLDADVLTLAHELRQPVSAVLRREVDVEACQQVEDRLWQVCGAQAGSCWVTATFYWAHDIPRCSARLELDEDWQDDRFSRLYTIDFAGESRREPTDACGDGTIDPGEACDDGNLEPFDGCDPDCQAEPFNGCETVIQQEFSAAEIAWIDAGRWQSPRSHVMVHRGAEPFAAVDGALCDRARTTAEAVCARLADEMPFVSYCVPEVHLTAPTTCDVRLRVDFLTPSPDDGVFTTALQGILAFELH